MIKTLNKTPLKYKSTGKTDPGVLLQVHPDIHSNNMTVLKPKKEKDKILKSLYLCRFNLCL